MPAPTDFDIAVSALAVFECVFPTLTDARHCAEYGFDTRAISQVGVSNDGFGDLTHASFCDETNVNRFHFDLGASRGKSDARSRRSIDRTHGPHGDPDRPVGRSSIASWCGTRNACDGSAGFGELRRVARPCAYRSVRSARVAPRLAAGPAVSHGGSGRLWTLRLSSSQR
jgi:hypothetical protein